MSGHDAFVVAGEKLAIDVQVRRINEIIEEMKKIRNDAIRLQQRYTELSETVLKEVDGK